MMQATGQGADDEYQAGNVQPHLFWSFPIAHERNRLLRHSHREGTRTVDTPRSVRIAIFPRLSTRLICGPIVYLHTTA
jgi:hypothetical protein